MAETPYPLGRIKLHDPRSRAFQGLMAPEIRTVFHRPPPLNRRLDQGHWWNPWLKRWLSLGSCTGNAVAQAQNCAPLHMARSAYRTEDDAVLRYYSPATQQDPWDGWYNPEINHEDTGSSVLTACKVAVAAGDAREYRWFFGRDQALHGLTLGPVIVGTEWREQMFDPDARGFLRVGGEVVGGHAYVLHGINVRDRYVHVLNSWGTGWGNNGRAKLSFDDLGALLAADGEAVSLIR